MKVLFIHFFIIFSLVISAQENVSTMENAPFTVRGTISIPRSIGSNMFRTAFNGVYATNLSVNYKLGGKFFVGLGYDNSHFLNNKKVFTFYIPPSGRKEYGLSYNTRIMNHAAFLNLGADQFLSSVAYVSYSLHSGIMQMSYMNVEADTNVANRPYPSTVNVQPYVQPELAINFIVGEERTLSLSIIISHTTFFSRFDPKAPRFNHFSEIYKQANGSSMNWLNIGFGFNVLINRKKA